jgi:organic hydroperoxide reductase OsmC/OhrA
MHPFPHVYQVTAAGAPADLVQVSSPGLPALQTAPPPQFDGPEGMWSPETLLCAAVANCFLLTFRAIARASKLEWQQLECRVDGTLERADGGSRFTRFVSHVTLQVPANADVERARLLLGKAEHGCLISNSLSAERELVVQVVQV